MFSVPEEAPRLSIGGGATPKQLPATPFDSSQFMAYLIDRDRREAEARADEKAARAEEIIRLEKKDADEKVARAAEIIRLEKKDADEKAARAAQIADEKAARAAQIADEKAARAAEIIRLEKKEAVEKIERQTERTRQENLISDRLDEEKNQRAIDRLAYEKFQTDKTTEERAFAAAEKLAQETRRIAEAARYETRLDKAYKTLRGQINRMPPDYLGIIVYLKRLEATFTSNLIDDDLRPAILISNLNDKGRIAYEKMSATETETFASLKEAILQTFQVSATSSRNDFQKAYKLADENFKLFAGRLRVLHETYLHSRQITSLQDLIELQLSDKFKDTLTASQKGHVGDREQNTWLPIDELAQVMDNYVVNHPSDTISGTGQRWSNRYVPPSTNNRPYQHNVQKNFEQKNFSVSARPPCTICSGTSHDAAHCFKAIGFPPKPGNNVPNVGRGKPFHPTINKMAPTGNTLIRNAHSKSYHTNVVTVEEEPNCEGEDINTDMEPEEQCYEDTDTNIINRIDVSYINNTVLAPEIESEKYDPCLTFTKNEGHFVQLKLGDKDLIGLVDSGAQISVLNQTWYPWNLSQAGQLPPKSHSRHPLAVRKKPS